MNPEPELWVARSSPPIQNRIAWLGATAGLLLMVGFRSSARLVWSDGLAGFLLGVLLLGICAAALLSGGKQTITVDPVSRRILVENISRFGTKTRILGFDEIESCRVSYIGDRYDGLPSYYVSAHLKTGKTFALFLGFYEGQHDRAAMQARCERLKTYLEG